MSTYNNLIALNNAREAVRKALETLRPEFGPLGDDAILKLAGQLATQGTNGTTAAPKALGPGVVQAKKRGRKKRSVTAGTAEASGSGDVLDRVNMPEPAKKLGALLRKKFQGTTFAMADIAKIMGVQSRAIVPYMVALEKNRLIRKTAKGKRNDQEVNIYRLGQALSVPTEAPAPDASLVTVEA